MNLLINVKSEPGEVAVRLCLCSTFCVALVKLVGIRCKSRISSPGCPEEDNKDTREDFALLSLLTEVRFRSRALVSELVVEARVRSRVLVFGRSSCVTIDEGALAPFRLAFVAC